MPIVDFSALNGLNEIIDYTLDGTFVPGGGINSIAQSCLDYLSYKYNIEIKDQVRINVRNYWKSIIDNVGIESITVQEIGDKTLSFLSLDDIFKKGYIKEDGNKKTLEYTPGNDGYNIKITDEKGVTSNISNPEKSLPSTNNSNTGENTPISRPPFSEPIKNTDKEPIPISDNKDKPERNQEDNSDISNLINTKTNELNDKIKNITDSIDSINKSVEDKIADISTTIDKTLDTAVDIITDTVKNIVDGIDDKIGSVTTGLLDITKGIIDTVTTTYNSMVSDLTTILSSMFDSISEEIKNVLSFLSGIITAIYDFIASLLDILKKAIDYLFEKLKEFTNISEDDIKTAMTATMEFIKNNILTPNFVSNLKPV